MNFKIDSRNQMAKTTTAVSLTLTCFKKILLPFHLRSDSVLPIIQHFISGGFFSFSLQGLFDLAAFIPTVLNIDSASPFSSVFFSFPEFHIYFSSFSVALLPCSTSLHTFIRLLQFFFFFILLQVQTFFDSHF